MKTSAIVSAAVLLSLTACNKEVGKTPTPTDELTRPEISLMTVTGSTKGYVETALFADTPYDKLHRPDYVPSESADAREMYLSAYLIPQAGIEGNYFIGYTYKRDASDGLWHNYVGAVKTPIYWPIGGTLNFLGISTKTDITSDLEWDEDDASSSVKLQADASSFSQDDILFASVSGRKVGANPTVDMEFQHAQAWIQFQLNADKEDVITILKVELKDVYSQGELSVFNNKGKAFANWNFRGETRSNLLMEDSYGVYGTPLKIIDEDNIGKEGDTIGYMDMLIPEQPKTAIVITYTLAGQSNELTYRYDLAHENWLMGKKYIYKVLFGINEITVKPTVVTFENGQISDFTPVNPS